MAAVTICSDFGAHAFPSLGEKRFLEIFSQRLFSRSWGGPRAPNYFAFTLREQEVLAALFHMTPYAWKTPKEGIERLQKINKLTVTAAFRVLIFEKDR